MSTDRGEYRSIRRVLLDGPDFQKLPERARWVFVALKLNVGPTGIDVVYPEALVVQLAAQTGAPREGIVESLDILEAAGWIRRESNVLWVVGHLENDPHMKPKDDKHRKAVAKHLAGLPRLALVRAFVGAHSEYFPPEDGPSEALRWAFEGPSKQGIGIGGGKGKRKGKVADAGASEPDSLASLPKETVDVAFEHWTRKLGAVNYGLLRKLLLPVFTVTPRVYIGEQLAAAIDAFEEGRKADRPEFRGKWTVHKFTNELHDWVRLGAQEWVDGFGAPTERGRIGLFHEASA